MANSDTRRSGNRRRPRGNRPPAQQEGLLPVLAKAVRDVENAVQRGRVTASTRSSFQAIGLLVREERARAKTDPDLTDAQRTEQMKRLDGLGTILAKTAAREPGLLALLADDAEVSAETNALRADLLAAGGVAAEVEETTEHEADEVPAPAERRVVPQSVMARQLTNPFMAPDFSAAQRPETKTARLSTWELIEPLLSSFERAADGAAACMALPEPIDHVGAGPELMKHQAEVVAAAAEGHRTFLLADEPGLGKTAQALLAAEAADAYPLLCVVPNIVKTNWAREAEIWTPKRSATVVHGDGQDVDGFADIVVVNYEILDRHIGWLGTFGFRGMVLDEAHFIKNKTSQRSQHALELSERIRTRTVRPLLMALTGTPLINDIDDFRAIWQFLGWIDEKKPGPELMHSLEETGLTPLDAGFYPAARQSVIDLGIVRRRKVDVASDIPARRIADLPVELDGEEGRSIRAAEQELARRMVARYRRVLAARGDEGVVDGINHELVRQVAAWERDEASESGGDNVFTMVRRIGRAKAGLAADYTTQLARSAGKVVFFAKHIEVMDIAEEAFTRAGLRHTSVRGDQTPKVRQEAIDAFTNDPDLSVVVCSLTAAGVGLNLQVASNVVLAELSWTDAEQRQAIDRVHRIGQTEPVTAWRILAAQTIDTKIVELIDSKAGLAARALEGSDEEVGEAGDVQLEALVALLTEALEVSSSDA